MIEELYLRCLYKSINYLSQLGITSELKLTLSPLEITAHSLFNQKEYYKLYKLLSCNPNKLTCECCPSHIQFLRIYSILIHKKILNQTFSFNYDGDDFYLQFLSTISDKKRKSKYERLKRIIEIKPYFVEVIDELINEIEDIEELKNVCICNKNINMDFMIQMFIFRNMRTEFVDYEIKDNENDRNDINIKDNKNDRNDINIKNDNIKGNKNGNENINIKNNKNDENNKVSQKYYPEILFDNLENIHKNYKKLRLAAIFYTLKEHEKALEIFNSVSIDYSNYRDLHSNIIYINNDLKNLSILSYESRNVGYSPEIMTIIGNFFSLRKDHPKAIIYYQKSIKLSSKFSINHTLIGHEYLQLNNYQAAIYEYSKAIEKNKYDHRAYFGIASVYTNLNQHQQSIYFYKKSAELREDPFILNSYAIALHKIKRTEDAIKILKMSINLKDTDAILQLADIYKSIKMYTEAVEYYEMYIKYVDDERIKLFLKEYYEKIGELNNAERFK